MSHLPTLTTGEHLRELEAQVDTMIGAPDWAIPSATRIILRSVSSLLMAARHLVEDQTRSADPVKTVNK